jgi:hypothetical protein
MPMASSFVPLRSRSNGSLLRGTARPEALAESAATLGYTALALTDRDGLYAAVPFVQAAREHGLRSILGVELGRGAAGKRAAALGARGDTPSVLVALARDRAGYASLCRLVTARHLEPERALEETCAGAGVGLHWVALEPRMAEALVARRRGAEEADDGRAVAALESIWVGVREPGPGGGRARRAGSKSCLPPSGATSSRLSNASRTPAPAGPSLAICSPPRTSDDAGRRTPFCWPPISSWPKAAAYTSRSASHAFPIHRSNPVKRPTPGSTVSARRG